MKTSNSSLSLVRDVIRLLFFVNFFVFAEVTEKILGAEIEFESEYIVLLAILLFGTFWCGWFCPFGNAQYFAGRIAKKLVPGLQVSVPKDVDRPLRYLKYLFLLMFLYIFATGEYGYFSDHQAMYQSTWYSSVYRMVKIPWAILILPFFIPRFFCKYLCYQKAGYQIINRVFPLLSIKRDVSKCTSCTQCTRECPMDIDIANVDRISGGECIGCLNCVDEGGCPTKPSSLFMTWFGKKVQPLTLSIIIITIYILLTAIMMLGF